MMIGSLIEYARRNGLGAVAVGPKTVKWRLSCSTGKGATPEASDFTITELGETENKKNRGRIFPVCPETPGLNSGGKSHVLVETVDVILGINEVSDKPESERNEEEQKKLAKLLAKKAFFLRSLESLTTVIPEAARFIPMLKDETFCHALFVELKKQGAKPSDKMTLHTLSEESGDSFFLVEDERWRPWWPEFLKTLSASDGAAVVAKSADAGDAGVGNGEGALSKKRQSKAKTKGPESNYLLSLVTGEPVVPAMTHPQITELADVGASSMGASFIGFDKDALQSYGFDKSANAAMSPESAAEYRAAINSIFRDHSRRYGDVKIGYWFSEMIPDEDDPIEYLENPEENQSVWEGYNRAGDLLEAWETGKKEKPTNIRFHSLILSGNAGRIIIRDWATDELVKIVEAVDRWFRDFEIIRRDGSEMAQSPKFYSIICSLLRDPSKEMKTIGPLIVALWKAALNPNLKIPVTAVRMAMRRHRVEMFGDGDKTIPPNHARMGLIRAYLIRNERDQNMKPGLNEDHPDIAYQCGRLMAILESLQYVALDGVNASVIQRFYNSAATTPNLVFARLMRMANIYIQKMKSGLADIYKKRIEDVYKKIAGDIPKTFSLAQQARFDMGYFQQSAQMRNEREERKAEKQAQNNLPEQNEDRVADF